MFEEFKGNIMTRNLTLHLLGLCFLIAPIAQAAAADVFAVKTNVVRHDAFRHVTGMAEANFHGANIAQVLTHNAQGDYWVKNINTNREWYAGKFETASIQELRDAIDARPPKVIRGTKRRRVANAGTFNVIAGFDPVNLTEAQQKRCNVTALQANPAHMRAVFQVASNFNCLEGAGPDLTNYTHARAQGELAAISALPGTIMRRYGLGPIDLLSNLPQVAFRLRGVGVSKHLDFTRTATRAIAEAATFNYMRVKVGIHFETDVTFGLVKAGARGAVRHHTTCRHYGDNDGRNQNIMQIYTSAVNLHLNAPRHFTPAEYANIETISQKMLKASYEGTLLAAALHGEQPEEDNKQQEVFLTLMGCGAFDNKLEWVADALEDLVDDIQELNLKVTLLVFDGSVAGMDDFLPRMEALVKQTGGEFEEIHPEEDSSSDESEDKAPAKKKGGCAIM